VIEIARFSGWPYLALVFTHDLVLHMSMHARAITYRRRRAVCKNRWNAKMAGMPKGQ
jgi:hypothetical protein